MSVYILCTGVLHINLMVIIIIKLAHRRKLAGCCKDFLSISQASLRRMENKEAQALL